MKTVSGIAASPGIAFGPAHRYLPGAPPVERHTIEDPSQEVERLRRAIQEADADLAALVVEMEQAAGREQAAIFEAHRMFMADRAFLGAAQALILKDQLNAEAAVDAVMNGLWRTFDAMDNEYFRARGGDVIDVGHRLIRQLSGIAQPALRGMPRPCIVIASDLTPSDTARMDREKVLGFCTAYGGTTAHSAILARSLGIPAVVAAGAEVLDIPDGLALILDGDAGVVIVEPKAETVKTYGQRTAELIGHQAKARRAAHEPAVTRDGYRVDVAANIASIAEVETALACGCEGVGLLRTEFLFLDRTTAPDEDEQAQAYDEIAQTLAPRPLIIRTLDIGGDKPVPYLSVPPEGNPFLGNRGLRLSLTEPEMFKVQLRAILRSSRAANVLVMFPMVGSVAEVHRAKVLLDEARNELEARRVPFGLPKVGIMVETPAAAMTADLLARHVDFFSIGTNDLTQYTLAADRTNAQVQNLADAMHPAVLRLIAETIRRAHEASIWVGVCGELAGDPTAVPVLLGLGLDEFSAAPLSVPMVKAEIRRWSLTAARAVAEQALCAESADKVRSIVESHEA